MFQLLSSASRLSHKLRSRQLTIARRSLLMLSIVLFSLSAARTQTPAGARPPEELQPAAASSSTVLVMATASHDRVRYISIGEAQQTRLQVFSPSGAQTYDSGFRLGNLIDWALSDDHGSTLSGGSYLFVVTVRDFSNNLTQKYGTATLEQGQVYLEQRARTELPPAQALALESSRLAETLSSIDRIGAAGLGHKTTTANSADGSTTNAQASDTARPSATTQSDIEIDSTGTQNRIAKWLDNAGTLGDSSMFDNGAGVAVGTTDLTDVLTAGNDKFKIVDGPMTFSFRNFAGGQGYFAVGSSTNGIKGFVGHTNDADGLTLGSFSNHKVTLRTNSVNRMVIDTAGNVGIGTNNPQSKLSVSTLNFTYGMTQTNGTVTVGTYVDPTAGWFGTRSNHPLNIFTNGGLPQLTLATNGNFGIGTVSPNTRLTLSGGPSWTTDGWRASMNMQNASAFGWEANASGQRFGIGQSNGGLYFFRTNSAFGDTSSLPNYDLTITNTGNIIQARDKGGMVKAMVHVNGDGTILRCYNGVTGESTGNCGGISSGRFSSPSGTYFVEFPFEITSRFYAITVESGLVNANATYGIKSSSGLYINVFDTKSSFDTKTDRPFMIIVY